MREVTETGAFCQHKKVLDGQHAANRSILPTEDAPKLRKTLQFCNVGKILESINAFIKVIFSLVTDYKTIPARVLKCSTKIIPHENKN